MGRALSKTFPRRDEETMVDHFVSILRGKKVTAVFILSFFFLAFFRLTDLASKAYHHDESLYAVYSLRYAKYGDYKFDPMLHGPWPFHFQAGLFKLLPINDFTGRLPSVLAGIGFVLLGIFLFQTSKHRFLWMGLTLTSPILCYFSRFLGMDMMMAFLAIAFLLSAAKFLETRKPFFIYLAAISFVLSACTKLNFLFYFFSFFSFFLIEKLFQTASLKTTLKFLLSSTIHFLSSNRKHVLISSVLCIVIFCLLFSSLGYNPGGILDALYRTMIPYWIHQHSIQRVGGPFHYYFSLLIIYELPLILGILWALYKSWKHLSHSLKLFTFIMGIAASIWTIAQAIWVHVGDTFQSLFHLQRPWHVSLLFLTLSAWFIIFRFHIGKQQRFPAFFLHWGAVSLLLYSYAGEKVPWLATHLVVPGYLYLAWVIPGWISNQSRRIQMVAYSALAFILCWQSFVMYRSSFLLNADPKERIVFTHTSNEIMDLVGRIDHVAKTTGEYKDLNIQVLGTGHAVWPLAWYLRKYEHWYWLNLVPKEDPLIVVDNWETRRRVASRLSSENYKIQRFRLREWWVPNITDAKWTDFIQYYISRKVFSPTGSQDIAVFIHEDVIDIWNDLNGPQGREG